ncbi:MAG: hypothetical protein KatS3mg088_629 [Patescibacteria group bacterium]|nr:MAG: hypothetical protein KatS3mg088_629 [Patescibacteria group bacterium]
MNKPAHSWKIKNRRILRDNHSSGKTRILLKIILAFILVFLFSLLIFNIIKASKERKILLAIAGGENFKIASFDFDSKETAVIEIPSNVEVEVARSLGNWELSSVWNLGENEKIGGGKLLVETLRNNFFAPVFFWTSEKGNSLLGGNYLDRLSFPFLERRSNLNFFQKIRLAIFSARFKESELTKINLSQTSFLQAARLKTGKDGYLIKGVLPEDLLWVYADPLFLKNKVFISVINESGGSLLVSKVGKIIESMGGKILSVENQNMTDSDCEVYSSNYALAREVALVFSCRLQESKDYKTQDGEIILKIGKKFKDRF